MKTITLELPDTVMALNVTVMVNGFEGIVFGGYSISADTNKLTLSTDGGRLNWYTEDNKEENDG